MLLAVPLPGSSARAEGDVCSPLTQLSDFAARPVGWDEVWDQGLQVPQHPVLAVGDFITTKGRHLEISMMNKVRAVCVRLFHAQELRYAALINCY